VGPPIDPIRPEVQALKPNSLTFLLLVLLMVTIPVAVQSQQPSSFTVVSIKPYEKAVPGQIMEALIEGLTPGPDPIVLPESDFKIEVRQDGVSQKAKVGITKFTMTRELDPNASNKNAVDFAGMKMSVYQSVTFVVPKGLHPGAAELIVKYKGKRGNSVNMQIVDKPLRPIVGTTSVLAIAGMPPDGPAGIKPEGNDLGWRLERGATSHVHVNPLVDPDDPNAAVLIRFKQGDNSYDAVTRVVSTPSKFFNRNGGVGFMAAREELEVDVPAALTLGKAEVEIRLKANDQVSDPVMLTATITDVTRTAEAPNVSAPRVLSLTPKKVGAGQLLLISVDQRRTLEPSPNETRVIIEQDSSRYLASIEQNSTVFGPSKAPDAPVGLFVRTTRQLIGPVQVRVLNPLRGEQTGMSAPVAVEIVDQVLPPELISVSESTDADLQQLKQLYEAQKQAGKDFPTYDPGSRYLTIRARGVDPNPTFVRITLEHKGEKFTLSRNDFSSYTGDGLIVRLPGYITGGPSGGEIKLTIENSGGDRYSTPVTQSFTLKPRE